MITIVSKVHISENETSNTYFSFAFGIKLLAPILLNGHPFEVVPPPQESNKITDFIYKKS